MRQNRRAPGNHPVGPPGTAAGRPRAGAHPPPARPARGRPPAESPPSAPAARPPAPCPDASSLRLARQPSRGVPVPRARRLPLLRPRSAAAVQRLAPLAAAEAVLRRPATPRQPPPGALRHCQAPLRTAHGCCVGLLLPAVLRCAGCSLAQPTRVGCPDPCPTPLMWTTSWARSAASLRSPQLRSLAHALRSFFSLVGCGIKVRALAAGSAAPRGGGGHLPCGVTSGPGGSAARTAGRSPRAPRGQP